MRTERQITVIEYVCDHCGERFWDELKTREPASRRPSLQQVPSGWSCVAAPVRDRVFHFCCVDHLHVFSMMHGGWKNIAVGDPALPALGPAPWPPVGITP